jgi:hypothetical protein
MIGCDQANRCWPSCLRQPMLDLPSEQIEMQSEDTLTKLVPDLKEAIFS